MKVSTIVLLAALAYSVSAQDCWTCSFKGFAWTAPSTCIAAESPAVPTTIADCFGANPAASFADASTSSVSFTTADTYEPTTTDITLAANVAYNYVFTNTLTDMAFTVTP